MRIHHLDCISTCPLGGQLMDERSTGTRGRLSCHCLLIEHPAGLVLVDTGFGLRDVREPSPRLSPFFRALLAPDLREERTAIRQIEQLGFSASDVRHIVLTHLDFDHAGGLDDFPGATVHLTLQERNDAQAQRSWLDRQRFRPQQWHGSRPYWRVVDVNAGGERWFGFEAIRDLEGLGDDILMIPLLGHTHGHTGVAVRRGDLWLLHTGDAYFFHGEMDPVSPHCTPGLQAYQTLMEKDRAARLHNQDRLRALVRDHSDEVEVFCSHDLREFERLSQGLRTREASALERV